jgi:phosphoglycolate phosphatase
MPRFDLIIFDLDGTLIDSQYDLAAAVNYTRLLYDMPQISLEEVRAYIGDGIKALMEKALPGIGEPEMRIAAIKFRTYYGENLLARTKLYPGVKQALETFSGFKKAILTNKPEAFTKTIIKNLGIEQYFDIVVGGDSGPKRKPDPGPLIDISVKLNVPAARALMVGDGKNDILAAKAAGIKCAAVQYGYTDIAEIAALHPDYCIKNIAELSGILNL